MTNVKIQQPVKEIIQRRSSLCKALQRVLSEENSIEVVTPILCPYPEIAPMPQFSTTHPKLGTVACLRVAPTEFLKRLLVAGAESVFEFSTNFRAEIVDSTHAPEFTSLEVMVTGASVSDMQDLTERLCRAGLSVFTSLSPSGGYTPPGAKRAYQVTAAWPRLSLRKFLYSEYDFPPEYLFDLEKVRALYQRIIGGAAPLLLIDAADSIVAAVAEGCNSPVFIGEYPYYLGGPAKPCDDDLRFKERTELFVGSMEMANMSSTLTDPTLLRDWHEQGLKLKEQLGIQPNVIDEPLLTAVAEGLPHSAVLGLGVERLLMVAAGLDDISLTRAFPYSQLFLTEEYANGNH